ncbi:uncharacterized protein METZ01_LOCUS85572, partial [marine metagenome]
VAPLATAILIGSPGSTAVPMNLPCNLQAAPTLSKASNMTGLVIGSPGSLWTP